MSDLDLSRGANSNEDRNAGSPKNLKDQMAEAGATVKQRADEAFRAGKNVLLAPGISSSREPLAGRTP